MTKKGIFDREQTSNNGATNAERSRWQVDAEEECKSIGKVKVDVAKELRIAYRPLFAKAEDCRDRCPVQKCRQVEGNEKSASRFMNQNFWVTRRTRPHNS